MPSACNMTAIFAARRLTARSAPCPRPAPQSGRSCVGQVAAESWYARSCAAAVAMYSVAAQTSSISISPGSIPNGRPPARVLSRLMLSEREQLTREDAITVASIERGVPMLPPARDLVERFHRMLRERDPDALPSWIADAAD